MEFQEVIAGRRSIRAYQKEPVSREKLDRVLRAAVAAPSAANRQPWKIYVVEDPEVKRELGKAYSNAWFFEAPFIVVICSIPSRSWKRCDGKNYADVDAAIAFDHLTLEAHAEGLGTCWIGAFRPELVRSALKLPAREEPIAMTPLGLPAQRPDPTPRKPIEELVEYR